MSKFLRAAFLGLLGMLVVLGSSSDSLALTNTILPVEQTFDGPILGLKPPQPKGIQLAHHTPEQWREFLRQRRAKKKRLKRQRLRARRHYRKNGRNVTKRKYRQRKLALAKPTKQRAVKKVSDLYDRKQVKYQTSEKPGTVIVDTNTKHLYFVVDQNNAIRYGVAVGKQGFAWSGTSTIKRKVEWPTWYPPKAMIKRKPSLKKWANGQPGGPKNPLGAAALYLFQGKKDTLYRIHGTNAPSSIGTAASSGCIRMRNEDIQHLYSKVNNGTKVIVR